MITQAVRAALVLRLRGTDSEPAAPYFYEFTGMTTKVAASPALHRHVEAATLPRELPHAMIEDALCRPFIYANRHMHAFEALPVPCR